MKRISGRDASLLGLLVGVDLKLPNTAYKILNNIQGKEAQKIGQTMIALFYGKKVQDKNALETALSIILWALGNHGRYHGKYTARASWKIILSCRCSRIVMYRRILKKYKKLPKPQVR